MKRSVFLFAILGVIHLSLILPYGFLKAQDNYFGLYPKNFMHTSQLNNIKESLKLWYEENTYIDSTTFTEITTDLPGIFNGTALWYDYDNDQDLDIIFSGTTDTIQPTLKIFLNENGIFNEIATSFPNLGHGSNFAWGDYDNDGDFDLAIQGSTNFPMTNCYSKIFRNDNNTFVDINAPLLGLAGGSVIWKDIDNDGFLDLLISGSPNHGLTFYTKIYKNTNNNFVEINTNLAGVWGSSIAFNDYDNDGDQDLLLTGYGNYGTTTKLYRNDLLNGTIMFVDTYAPFIEVNSGSIAWGDYNNDGFDDVAISGISYGIPITKIYKNNNGLFFTDINANLKPLAVSSLAWGDYNNDGLLDLIISGSEDFEQGLNPTTKIYRNNGESFIDIKAKLLNVWFGSVSWGDYNNDNKLDLLITGSTISRPDRWWTGPYYPVTKIYKNNISTNNSPPTIPTNLALTISQGKAKLTWQSSTDDNTPQNVISYNLRIGKTPGGHEIFAPNSHLYSGFRRIPLKGNQGILKHWYLKNLPPGTYYWNVQAIDNSFTSSGFANEQSFIVTPTGDINENHPENFKLFQNYPNPFNSYTKIKFVLNTEQVVTLKVFNIFGQEIETLINNRKFSSGEYSIGFSGNNLSSGIYIYKLFLDYGKKSDMKKMVLIK